MRVFMYSCLAIALIAVSATVVLDFGFQEGISVGRFHGVRRARAAVGLSCNVVSVGSSQATGVSVVVFVVVSLCPNSGLVTCRVLSNIADTTNYSFDRNCDGVIPTSFRNTRAKWLAF